MSNFKLLNEFTNSKINKIKYGIKACIITSSIAATILNILSVSFAAPPETSAAIERKQSIKDRGKALGLHFNSPEIVQQSKLHSKNSKEVEETSGTNNSSQVASDNEVLSSTPDNLPLTQPIPVPIAEAGAPPPPPPPSLPRTGFPVKSSSNTGSPKKHPTVIPAAREEISNQPKSSTTSMVNEKLDLNSALLNRTNEDKVRAQQRALSARVRAQANEAGIEEKRKQAELAMAERQADDKIKTLEEAIKIEKQKIDVELARKMEKPKNALKVQEKEQEATKKKEKLEREADKKIEKIKADLANKKGKILDNFDKPSKTGVKNVFSKFFAKNNNSQVSQTIASNNNAEVGDEFGSNGGISNEEATNLINDFDTLHPPFDPDQSLGRSSGYGTYGPSTSFTKFYNLSAEDANNNSQIPQIQIPADQASNSNEWISDDEAIKTVEKSMGFLNDQDNDLFHSPVSRDSSLGYDSSCDFSRKGSMQPSTSSTSLNNMDEGLGNDGSRSPSPKLFSGSFTTIMPNPRSRSQADDKTNLSDEDIIYDGKSHPPKRPLNRSKTFAPGDKINQENQSSVPFTQDKRFLQLLASRRSAVYDSGSDYDSDATVTQSMDRSNSNTDISINSKNNFPLPSEDLGAPTQPTQNLDNKDINNIPRNEGTSNPNVSSAIPSAPPPPVLPASFNKTEGVANRDSKLSGNLLQNIRSGVKLRKVSGGKTLNSGEEKKSLHEKPIVTAMLDQINKLQPVSSPPTTPNPQTQEEMEAEREWTDLDPIKPISFEIVKDEPPISYTASVQDVPTGNVQVISIKPQSGSTVPDTNDSMPVSSEDEFSPITEINNIPPLPRKEEAIHVRNATEGVNPPVIQTLPNDNGKGPNDLLVTASLPIVEGNFPPLAADSPVPTSGNSSPLPPITTPRDDSDMTDNDMSASNANFTVKLSNVQDPRDGSRITYPRAETQGNKNDISSSDFDSFSDDSEDSANDITPNMRRQGRFRMIERDHFNIAPGDVHHYGFSDSGSDYGVSGSDTDSDGYRSSLSGYDSVAESDLDSENEDDSTTTNATNMNKSKDTDSLINPQHMDQVLEEAKDQVLEEAKDQVVKAATDQEQGLPTTDQNTTVPVVAANSDDSTKTSLEEIKPLVNITGNGSGGSGGDPDESENLPPKRQTLIVDHTTDAFTQIKNLAKLVGDQTFCLNLTPVENMLRSRNSIRAIGSGTEDGRLGKNLWVSTTYGKSKYNKGENPGSRYAGKTNAVAIGSDIEFANGGILGLAYSYIDSNFKFKEQDNQVAVKTHLVTLYGQSNLTDKLILQGFFSLGKGDIYTKLQLNNQVIKNKIKHQPCSSKVSLAHQSKIGNVIVVPNIALKYGSYNLGGYTQNYEAQSLSVLNQSSKKTSGIIGIETAIPLQVTNTTLVTPALYVEAEKFFYNKQSTINVVTTSNYSRPNHRSLLAEKPAKYSYKFGGSLSIKHGRAEIVAIYDYLTTDKKYTSHQGSIKLKLAF